jgi:uncharacterized protein YraI
MSLSLHHLIRLILLGVALAVLATGTFVRPGAVHSQDAPTVWVEAIQFANVRAGPAVNYPQIGTITAGTKYPMIGRSARFPWYLIQLPETEGWVYVDVVKVTGNPKSVPITEKIISLTPGPTPPPTDVPNLDATLTPTLAATATLTPTSEVVTAEALDTANVRYGPGTDFPRIGSISKGTQYPVLHRHSLFPWLEIAFDGVPSGRGWVFRQTVRVYGDLSKVPITSSRDFGYPTLTPTPQMIVTSVPPFTATLPPGTNDLLGKLASDIYDYLLQNKFEPGTDTQGSAFLLDLRTGHAISLNPGVAYSGMSLAKIPILVSLYRKLDTTPNKAEAEIIAEMMICSENLASNTVLKWLGDGDPEKGAQYVTETMHAFGFKSILLLSSFWTGAKDTTPTSPPQPIPTVQTGVDQTSTEPDPYNQATPADMGWLLAGIYQCALDGSGVLNATFPNAFTVNECRQMIGIMRADKIGAMIEAGVPADIPVAHKHGWINDTHGDAAYVSTPGGDYILVVMLHNKTWLNYENSFPVIAEISRMTYNAYNPARLLDKTHTQPVPECSAIPPDVLAVLQASNLPPIR